MALGIAAAWGATTYQGAGGIYPLVLGLLLAVLGTIVALRAVLSRNSAERILIEAPVKLWTAVAAVALYVALVVPLGFYTASLLLMLAMPFALGFRRFAYALTVAVIFVAIVYGVFSVLLEKPLPREAIVRLIDGGA